MEHKKPLSAGIVLAFTLIFGTTASAHLPYVLPFQFNTDQDVATLYAGLADRYFEPEIPGGGTEGGCDIFVTNPDGETRHVEQISRHKQLTIIEINTKDNGTYKVERTLISRVFPQVLRDGRAINVYKDVSPERKEKLEARKIKDGVVQFLFDDEVKPDETIEAVHFVNHVTAYVTRNKPNDAALKTTGKGFEFDFKTHPNSISVNSNLKFIALVDGKAAPGIGFEIFKQGLGESFKSLKSDSAGIVNVLFKQAGIYVLRASAPLDGVQDGKIANPHYINWLIIEVTP
jgi:hypothetical protein